MTRSVTCSVWLAAAAVLAAAMLPGCTQAVGIEVLPVAIPFHHAEPGCGACISKSCQAQEDACRVDADCAAPYRCLASCPLDDWECRAGCQEGPRSLLESPAFEALDGCRRTSCVDQCLGVGSPATVHGAACEACIGIVCAEATRACLAIADCERTAHCALSCRDPDCVVACSNQHDGSFGSIISEYLSCMLRCPDACAFGQSWQCVGDYDWRPPKSPGAEITLRFRAGQYPDDGAAAGVAMRACADLPPPGCSTLASDITDDEGVAELQLGVSINGFTGYLEASGQLGGGELVSMLLDYSRPFVMDERNLGNPVFTKLQFQQIAASLAVELIADRGHLQITHWDCASLWARGLKFTLDSAELPADPPPFEYYFGGEVTDAFGSGVFVNVPPGEVTVRAHHGDKIVSTYVTHVVAERLTVAALWPQSR